MLRETIARMWSSGRAAVVLAAALLSSFVTAPVSTEPPSVRARPPGKVDRKQGAEEPSPPHPLLATLVDTHSPVRLGLDEVEPGQARFEALLRDPVLGSTHAIDPALLGLVRALAARHPLARIEVVSGFRSPKLNEALRKKGHHVASHSQHTLGHALDLRVIPDGAADPIDPRALAAEIRRLGWGGGVGVYPQANDRFVHADVGPLRTWYGQ